MKIVSEISYRGRNFTIVNKDGYYMAIEDKYITDGRLNRTLNGIDTFADKRKESCIGFLKNSVDIDHYMSEGCSKAEAFCKVFTDIPLELADKMFNQQVTVGGE